MAGMAAIWAARVGSMERLPDCARVWSTVAKKRMAAAKSVCRIVLIDCDFNSTSRSGTYGLPTIRELSDEIGVLYEQGLDVKCFSLSGSLLLSLRLLLLSTGF